VLLVCAQKNIPEYILLRVRKVMLLMWWEVNARVCVCVCVCRCVFLCMNVCVYSCVHGWVDEWMYVRGMFKKRLNFLNITPTSTESVLRLLSTPSIKFGQRTAICPILL